METRSLLYTDICAVLNAILVKNVKIVNIIVDLQDDLLKELEELEQQDLEEKLIDVGPTVELPSVPSAVPSEPSRGT